MRKLFIIIILLSSTIFYAQKKKKDTLKTEEILVVKPYTPSIANAFKIKSNPSLEGIKNTEKEIDYIFQKWENINPQEYGKMVSMANQSTNAHNAPLSARGA